MQVKGDNFQFMGNILSNIKAIADNEGITIGALEKKIGASKGVLSRAFANGTDIQSKWVQLIVENYPQYSADWLLLDDGPMLKEAKDESIISSGIPLIPLSAMAGSFMGEQQVLECECERYVIPAFQGADFLIHVKGDSMQPSYKSGDIVACRRVPLDKLFFQWNHTYVLDTDQGALIKRIKEGSDNEHVLIVSDNEEYTPFELPIECIYGVALVVGLIRLE